MAGIDEDVPDLLSMTNEEAKAYVSTCWLTVISVFWSAIDVRCLLNKLF